MTQDFDAVNKDAAGATPQPEVTVQVVRSVQINRLLIIGVIVGAALGVLGAIAFPVDPNGHYTLGQIAGFAAVLGAAAGLFCAGLFALLLSRAVRRKHGRARAVQTGVR